MNRAADLEKEFDSLDAELQVCRRRLESKVEALIILSKELDQCRTERDQFKLMAEQLRERYQSLKWQVSGKSPLDGEVDHAAPLQLKPEENLSMSLYRAKEANKCLQFEVDDLKQKLTDAEGDVKLLREQIARQRVGTSDEGMNTRHFPAHERQQLVKQLEAKQEYCCQLERDLQQVIDEKEEQETERDAFKHKYERLNTELNYILRGDENRILDIDALVNENKYLSERLQQMEEEKTIALATVTKYKNILEKRKTRGILKLGQTRNSGVVISQKQVHHLLENESTITATPQTIADLQALSKALLDSLNDKSLALSHQRKTNKILGTRVAELEKKLKTLEMGGFWNLPANQFATLEKLKSECCDIKSLIPDEQSSSGQTNEETVSDTETAATDDTKDGIADEPRSPLSPTSESLLADLDLLPTREKERAGDLRRLESCLDCDDDTSPDDNPGRQNGVDSPTSDDAEGAKNALSADTYIDPNEDIENEFQSLLEDATSKVTNKGQKPRDQSNHVKKSRDRRSVTSSRLLGNDDDDDEDCAGLL